MKRDYKAETIAKATVRNVPDVLVIRVESASVPGTLGWTSPKHVSGHRWHTDDKVADIRSVIILEGPDEVLKSASRFLLAGGFPRLGRQIRRQLPRPKPDEPTGLGAVVRTEDGRRWTRANGAGEWFSEDGDNVLTSWDDFEDSVVVAHDGVTP